MDPGNAARRCGAVAPGDDEPRLLRDDVEVKRESVERAQEHDELGSALAGLELADPRARRAGAPDELALAPPEVDAAAAA